MVWENWREAILGVECWDYAGSCRRMKLFTRLDEIFFGNVGNYRRGKVTG